MTNPLNRFGCRRASEGDPSRRVCAVAAPLGEQRRCQSLSIPVLTCDVPSFSTPLITEEGLGVGGRPLFTRLSIWLSVSARPLSCDHEFGRLKSKTMSRGGREPWPPSRTHLGFLLYQVIIAICRLCVKPFTQLYLSKRRVSNSCGNRSHTWAGSFVYWWTRHTTTLAAGCNPAGIATDAFNATRKPFHRYRNVITSLQNI